MLLCGAAYLLAGGLSFNRCAAQTVTAIGPVPDPAVTAATQQPATLRGVVLNAVNGQPVARALVQAGSHAVLTEHDGKFEFSDLTGSSAQIRVTKPGFYQGPNQDHQAMTVALASAVQPIEVRIFPEALITGAVIAANGDPLPQINVEALRRSADEAGQRWMVAAQTNTNADGEFRLPLPGGDYVVQTRYSQQRSTRQAILPVTVPDTGSSAQPRAASTIHVASGTEQHLELQPQVRASYPVHLQVDGAGERFVSQLQARMSDGTTFNLPLRRTGASGELTIDLPSGTFILSASSLTLSDNNGMSYGETRVSVGDNEISGVPLHLSRVPPLTIEVAVDPSSTSDNGPPTAAELGLFFYREDAAANPRNQNEYVTQRNGGQPSVTLLPGNYRLRAMGSATWFVESANFGGTDLLTHEIAVDAGSSGTPLRLLVSNRTGAVKAAIKLGEQPAACWVYLIATNPSVTPVRSGMSGSDGSFYRASVPPGTYRAIAFEERQAVDFTDPTALDGLASYVQTVTLAAGETAAIDLSAVPALESKH